MKYQHVLAYINLFNYCYANPYQLAQLLAIGDQLALHSPNQSASLRSEHIAAVSRTIATGLYGSALNSADTQIVLQLLKHLIEIQIVANENPRRLLRTGSCAFARFYHSLHESLFSAKMFLTVALNDSIMRVLIDDEVALELDPSKAAMSLPPAERQKKFGSEQDDEYAARVKQYVLETTNTLHKFIAKFIRSLSNSWCLFPATLRWLVKTMCYQLRRAKFDERCIYEMLTDMVLINFICPAIVSPEVFGITDCPISANARGNLITIGQILQQMALLKYQAGDRKFHDLFAKFEPNEVSDLLTQLLELETPDPLPPVNSLDHPTAASSGEVHRSNVLVAQTDLNMFVEYIRVVLSNDELNLSGECRRKLGDILGQLPHELENLLTSPVVGSSGTGSGGNEKKSGIINIGKQTKQKLSKTLSLGANHQSFDEGTDNRHCDPAVVLVIPLTINQAGIELLSEEEVMSACGAAASSVNNGTGDDNLEKHLVNPGTILENGAGTCDAAGVGAGSSLTDILSEQNVVELQRQQHGQGTENPEMIILKADRTKHFAMHNDDVSIGNTSDNLEAVSEAHSNHSLASSLDSENDQNDNLSDMVSANVSGRGSPNISGRDTPSSQVTEGNETQRPPVLPAAKMLNKARSDIEDKFCKFEIKKMPAGDETVSIMSDTWSTDVLASDSETVDAGSERDRQFSTPLIPASVILPGDNDFVSTLGNGALPERGGNGGGGGGVVVGARHTYDISETQSESAWSMDVLASDSEKLAEIDTDDNQSIAARSDITDASSAPDGASYRDGNNNGGTSNNNNPDSPFFAARGSVGNNETNPDSPAAHTKRGGSVFFGLRRSHQAEEHNQSGGCGGSSNNGEDSRFMAALRQSGSNMSRNSSFQSDRGAGSHGATAVSALSNPFLTPNRNSGGGGGNKGSGAERNKKFYSTRQQSSESNQSSTFDDLKHESFDSWKESGGRASNGGGHHSKKGGKPGKSHEDRRTQSMASPSSKTAATPIESIIRTNSNLTNPFVMGSATGADDAPVECRTTSMEQRHASFDGRRNGMMQVTSQSSSVRQSSKSSTVVRNYENHEIIMRHSEKAPVGGSRSSTTVTTTSSSTSATFRNNEPEMGHLLDLRSYEGGRVEGTEELLVQKTKAMSLMAGSSDQRKAGNGDVLEPYRNGLNLPNGTVTKAGKFTGAIPKSISFDATADKRHDHGHHKQHHQASQHYQQQRSLDHSHGGNGRPASQNSSFLNKIRQGLKSSGRKGNKSHGGANNGAADQSNLDAFNNNGGGDVGNLIDMEDTEQAYQETSEDILAKYRRKVSTASSEANASDSTSGSRASSSFKSKNSTDSDYRSSTNGDLLRLSIPPVSSNDLFHFNNAKKKLRTVLSSADVHTTDFRYNLVSGREFIVSLKWYDIVCFSSAGQ